MRWDDISDRRFFRFIATLLLATIFGYALIAFFFFFTQRSIMYPAPQAPSAPFETVHLVDIITTGPHAGLAVSEKLVGKNGELSDIPADGLAGDLADGQQTITGWFIPPVQPDKPVIIFFHGNAGKLEYRANWAYARFLDGYGVFLAGYRGYEGEEGEPSEENLYQDARAQIQWLINKGYVNLVMQGESLGTAIAVKMANEFPAKAVILEAPFDSMVNVALSRYGLLPVDSLLKDRYESINMIADINAPLFIIHGTADRVVPVWLGQRLFVAAKEPKKAAWIDGATHSNLYDYDANMLIQQFLDQYAPSR